MVYTDLISKLRTTHPTIDLDRFSPIESEGIAEVCDLSTSEALFEPEKMQGMHGLPGGASRKCLLTSVGMDISPKRLS